MVYLYLDGNDFRINNFYSQFRGMGEGRSFFPELEKTLNKSVNGLEKEN